MGTDWNSDLFVYSDAQGRQFISAALPTGVAIPASAWKRYRASGPYMPVSFPAPTAVDDAAAWIAAEEKEGFAFVPSAV